MRSRILLFLFSLSFASQALASCEGMPWKFGMSPGEVAGISECGPYKSFSNGDLETYDGIFDGQKENFQFFFEDGKLRRIGIYLYEGQDPEAGAKEWLGLYGTLSRLFGKIETPDNIAPAGNEATDASFTEKALKVLQDSGKTQMAPITQPKDAFVFSSFVRNAIEGQTYYNVILYFDRRSQ